VPVITLAGKAHAGRVGVSLLTQAGLTELIAESPDDYVRIAAELANSPARLSELRSTLRRRMVASPLCDAKAFAQAVEDAYRVMWREWCEA
jgi:predicted O-linked N-acetylglucosamine transferase (SPINDLY family)